MSSTSGASYTFSDLIIKPSQWPVLYPIEKWWVTYSGSPRPVVPTSRYIGFPSLCLFDCDCPLWGWHFQPHSQATLNIWIMPLILLTLILCSLNDPNVSLGVIQRKLASSLIDGYFFFHCKIINWNLTLYKSFGNLVTKKLIHSHLQTKTSHSHKMLQGKFGSISISQMTVRFSEKRYIAQNYSATKGWRWDPKVSQFLSLCA